MQGLNLNTIKTASAFKSSNSKPFGVDRSTWISIMNKTPSTSVRNDPKSSFAQSSSHGASPLRYTHKQKCSQLVNSPQLLQVCVCINDNQCSTVYQEPARDPMEKLQTFENQCLKFLEFVLARGTVGGCVSVCVCLCVYTMVPILWLCLNITRFWKLNILRLFIIRCQFLL